MATSPRHIFAIKALAVRTHDIDDLRLLAGIVGVESVDAALQICANFYPDEPVSPRSAAARDPATGSCIGGVIPGIGSRSSRNPWRLPMCGR
jgi:hypothetical protein